MRANLVKAARPRNVRLFATRNSHATGILGDGVCPLATTGNQVLIPPSMSAPNNTSKPLAYVVDDEPMLLDLNEDILRSIGFDVRRFRAAELALDAYRATEVRPAIIITDYAMHQMTGMDLIAGCRALQPGQKIILVSGTVNDTVFQDAVERPNCFMPKPYTAEDLTSAVRRLTGIAT